jgi:hypothetical protein
MLQRRARKVRDKEVAAAAKALFDDMAVEMQSYKLAVELKAYEETCRSAPPGHNEPGASMPDELFSATATPLVPRASAASAPFVRSAVSLSADSTGPEPLREFARSAVSLCSDHTASTALEEAPATVNISVTVEHSLGEQVSTPWSRVSEPSAHTLSITPLVDEALSVALKEGAANELFQLSTIPLGDAVGGAQPSVDPSALKEGLADFVQQLFQESAPPPSADQRSALKSVGRQFEESATSLPVEQRSTLTDAVQQLFHGDEPPSADQASALKGVGRQFEESATSLPVEQRPMVGATGVGQLVSALPAEERAALNEASLPGPQLISVKVHVNVGL